MSLLDWISRILTTSLVTGIIAVVLKDRPRVISTKYLGNFINYEKGYREEEKEFEIKWGVFDYTILPFWGLDDHDGRLKRTSRMRDILLDQVQDNATVDPPYYYKTESLDVPIPEYAYKITEPKKRRKKIYLIKRKFYRKENIDRVFVTIKTPIDLSFKDNITHEFNDEFIQITNLNRLDVINYRIEIPDDITTNMIDSSNNHIEDITNQDNRRIMVIRRVAGRIVDQAGRIKIPLR